MEKRTYHLSSFKLLHLSTGYLYMYLQADMPQGFIREKFRII